MSTRAMILLTSTTSVNVMHNVTPSVTLDNVTHLYKHYDGYPEGVLPALTRYVAKTVDAGRQPTAEGIIDALGGVSPTTDVHGDIQWLYCTALCQCGR